MIICPAGHRSIEADYCSVCGVTLATSLTPNVPTPHASVTKNCPFCGHLNGEDVLFCEACGYDFTTGAKPLSFEQAKATLDLDVPVAVPTPVAVQEPEKDATSPSPPATPVAAELESESTAEPQSDPMSFTHVAEIWVDPQWYHQQESTDPMPSPGLPMLVPLRGTTLSIGRASKSKNIIPAIDCGNDTGCSRQQAELSTDGYRWWITDLGSANGTYVGVSGTPLPQNPITHKTELNSGDRIYVGAWTRIVIRKATADELTVLKD